MEDWSPWVPILRVSDGRKSARFYADALDLKIDWEHRFADDFPLYMQISRPPLVLHLSEHTGTAAGPTELFVRVPDVDAVHATMLRRGIQPATRPTDQPYGLRDFCVVDPDGHRITLGTPVDFPTERHETPQAGGESDGTP